ncbi:MAG TPA: helix-turn-helix domain-containing protein [Pseudonocardia sp.]|jgi:AcrR family transcriptional regulator
MAIVDAQPSRKRRAYAARVPASQRRGQLLDAALHLVVTRGHTAVTMEAVAEQIGVTKPVVYSQFASRAELLAELLRREQEQAIGQLAGLGLELAPGEHPAELVARLLAGYLGLVRDNPDRWHCIVMPMSDMPVEFHAAREQARAAVLARAVELADRLNRATCGADTGLDTEIAGHAMVALFEMAARLVLADPEHFAPARFVSALSATLTRGDEQGDRAVAAAAQPGPAQPR